MGEPARITGGPSLRAWGTLIWSIAPRAGDAAAPAAGTAEERVGRRDEVGQLGAAGMLDADLRPAAPRGDVGQSAGRDDEHAISHAGRVGEPPPAADVLLVSLYQPQCQELGCNWEGTINSSRKDADGQRQSHLAVHAHRLRAEAMREAVSDDA